MDLTHWIMTISAILIFKFNRDEIGTSWPLIYFIYFHFFGLRKNLSIFPIKSSCSIGIKCHFVPSQRTLFSKSQDKNSLSFFDYRIKIHLYLYNIIFLFRFIAIRSRLDVPKIYISLHPIFLFRQSYEEWMRDKDSHFQSTIDFIEYCYCIKYWSEVKNWKLSLF